MLVTLPAYILRELCKAFGVSLLIYSFVILGLFSASLLREDVTLTTVLTVVPHLFPMGSGLILPISVITAILIAYGRLAASNEYIASQASGVHPFWIGIPGITMAFFASVITVYLNADVLTSSVVSIQKAALADRANIISAKLRKPGSFSFQIPNSYTIAICRLSSSWDENGRTGIDFSMYNKPRKVTDPNKLWDTRYPYPKARTLSKSHKISVLEDEKGTMTIIGEFWDAIGGIATSDDISAVNISPRDKTILAYPKDGFDIVIDPKRTQYMGLDKLILKKNEALTKYQAKLVNEMDLIKKVVNKRLSPMGRKYREEEPVKKLSEFTASDSLDYQKLFTLVDNAYPVLQKDPAVSVPVFKKNYELRKREFINLKGYMEMFTQVTAELHVKLVMSFACISFAIIGVPIALLGKRDSSVLGFVIGLGFSFAFYMIITALHGAVRDGSLPWYALWSPNGILLVVGVFLWSRIIKSMS